MNWDRLQTKNYFADPVEHIHGIRIVDDKEYDKLYENQNNFSHKVWKEFDEKYKLGFEFFETLEEINYHKEIICLWMFKERNDQTITHIDVGGRRISYFANAIIMTPSKKVKPLYSKRKYIRHPFMQIDITKNQYNSIVDNLK